MLETRALKRPGTLGVGETFLDDGGFRILQQKNGRRIGEIWCPIEEPLAAEMATWERAPGPYVRQANGKAYTKQLFEVHFSAARAAIPELAGVTFHGLRATRVIELRRAALPRCKFRIRSGCRSR